MSRFKNGGLDAMLVFNINATDMNTNPFPVVLQVPTQGGEASARWATYPGMLSFRGGPAWIIASPAANRGTVMCMGVDVDGGNWAAIELDQLFTQFSKNADGSYAMLSLNYSGSGQTFPDTVVSLQAGPISWQLSLPNSPSTP
jgi:hypothetical protein